MTDQAAAFIGSIPENYDKWLRPIIFADFANDLAQRMAQFEFNCVLELAAGTGIASRTIRDALQTDCEFVVTDLNEPMLGAARGLVYGNPLYDEIVNRNGDPNEICLSVASAIEDNLGGKTHLQAIVVSADKD